MDDVSFTIAPGAPCAAAGLAGASGSGKSTLAKMITGSERPTGGSITPGETLPQRLPASGLRAGAPRLLAKLREDRTLSVLYITHDLLSARLVSGEIRGRPACESHE